MNIKHKLGTNWYLLKIKQCNAILHKLRPGFCHPLQHKEKSTWHCVAFFSSDFYSLDYFYIYVAANLDI